MFKHRGCGGTLMIDLTGGFSISTPSVAVTPEGVGIGPIEIAEGNSRTPAIAFNCRECGNKITDYNDVEIVCDICQRYRPVVTSFVIRGVGCTCEVCKDVVDGKKQPTNERQKLHLKYLKPNSRLESIKITDVFAKPILAL
jgi:hypothetical protein